MRRGFWARGSAAVAVLPLFLLGAAPLGVPPAAAALRYEGTLGVATGDYIFTEQATTWSLTTALAAGGTRLSGRVWLPIHLQSSDLMTTTGVGIVPSGGPIQDEVVSGGRQGGKPAPASHGAPIEAPDSLVGERRVVVGDPMAMLSLTPLLTARFSGSVSIAAKAPLASVENYGTGSWDVGASVGLLVAPSSSWVVGADVAWWSLGDLDTLDLRSPWSGTLSVGRRWGSDWLSTVNLFGGESAIYGYDGPVGVGLSVSRSRGGRSTSLFVTIGLSETAPAFASSLAWGLPLSHP